MLKQLDIENIAIIEKASVGFSGGLNILTGETGAGKSIIIDSINAVTGEKASRDLIRTGENRAFVSAFFENCGKGVAELLDELGIPAEEDGTVLLQRSFSRDGKNVCHINGSAVTVSMLKSVGRELINIHGQRDSQALLDSEKHIGFLDSFAGITAETEAYGKVYSELTAVKNRIKALQTDDAEKARRADLLEYQINELASAEITEGEREALNRKKNLLINSRKLSGALNSALSALAGSGGEGGACSLINDALNEINSASQYANGLGQLSDGLANAKDIVDDASAAIEDVLGGLSQSEEELDAVEERLDLLYRLSRKYGDTETEMLAFLENARKQLAEITDCDELLEKLGAEYDALLTECTAMAAAITEKRKAAGKKLSADMENELAFLSMPSCRFMTGIENCPLCPSGTDRVEFMISANAGEDFKPLGKVASGGELSRIMLAMKNILTSENGVDTLIFDEIDTGVSGAAAGKIAVKLAGVSEKTQVLCITHLAQIAAFADHHLFIYKEETGGKTYTRIDPLDRKARAGELARINFGAEASAVQISSAEQMIDDAEKVKNSKKTNG